MSDAGRDPKSIGDRLETPVDRRSLLVNAGLTTMAAVSASVAGAAPGFVDTASVTGGR
jgi:hypothetical protein